MRKVALFSLLLIAGLITIPVLLAKLWSVIPRLFAWPPVKSPAHALERATLLMLVGGIVASVGA